MISNVKVLERERSMTDVSERPDRAEVEDAFRTIIRWTG
ncbi:MAG: GTP cyclohydrolase I FolE, partial [Bradyrhizobiaceae bacterium]